MSRMKRCLAMLCVSLCALACSGEAPDDHDEDEAGEVHADSGRVTLSEAAIVTAEILVEPAISEVAANAAAGLEVPGEVQFDQRRVAIISPRADGRLEQVLFVVGDRVGAGQTVANMFTPSFVAAQTEFLLARRRAATLAGTADAQGAQALVEAAARRLRVIGASTDMIAQLAASGQVRESLPIQAPFGGSIVEVNALPGAAITAGSPIFKIANLAYVDVAAAIPERALPLVTAGLKASVYLPAYAGVPFEGNVERMDQQIDPSTRTVNAIIHVQNINSQLLPGMFATVRLHTPVTAGTPNSEQQVVTIPQTALINEGDQRFVFIEVAPRTFEKRAVQTASLEAPGAAQPLTSRVVVLSGVRAGERVVIRGAFTLKSELGKASLGGHGH